MRDQGYGVAGVVIQILMLYLVTRNLIAYTTFSNDLAPITGTVQFRAAAAMLLAWIAMNSGGLRQTLVGFRPWGWVVIGSFVVVLVVEGIVTIASGEMSKRVVVHIVDHSIVLFAVSVSYLYATRDRSVLAGLRFLLQPYCYLAVFISVSGFIIWIMVHFEVVDAARWYPPEGLLKKDVESGSGHFYTMPFYLSLVTQSGWGSFLGFTFRRASGIFSEPAITAHFLTPAMFLLPLISSNKWKIFAGIVSIISYLALVHSITNLTLLSILGSMFFARKALTADTRRARFLAAMGIVVLVALMTLTALSTGTARSKLSILHEFYIEPIQFSLAHGKFLGPGTVRRFTVSDDARDRVPRGLLSLGVMFTHLGLLTLIGLLVMFRGGHMHYVGVALAYFAGHSLKSFGQISTSGFYIYMLIVMGLAVAVYWSTADSKVLEQARATRDPARFVSKWPERRLAGRQNDRSPGGELSAQA